MRHGHLVGSSHAHGEGTGGQLGPAMWETRVQSLGQDYPLEKEMATHSSILAWEILCTEEPGGLQSHGVTRVGHNLAHIPSLYHPEGTLLSLPCPQLELSDSSLGPSQ